MVKCIDIKNHKGITMIALIVTLIVLLIIAGISLTGGTKMVQKAKAENIATNMISMRAKMKIYMEEVNSVSWNSNDTEKANKKKLILEDKYKLELIENNQAISEFVNTNGCTCYDITKDSIIEMKLKEIYGFDKIGTDGIQYIGVVNNTDFSKIEIVYIKGVDYLGEKYYTLSDLQENL